jgi:ribosome-binding factor A
MLPYKRSKRVGDLLREVIAEIIMRRLKDPRLRQEVAKEVKMKFIPHFHFVLDTSAEYGAKIDSLLKEIKKKEEDK